MSKKKSHILSDYCSNPFYTPAHHSFHCLITLSDSGLSIIFMYSYEFFTISRKAMNLDAR